MKPVKIIITVDGTNRKDIPLSEFVRFAGACHKLLQHTARNVLDNHSCDFLLSDLSHNSPATIEITPTSPQHHAGSLIAGALAMQVREIKSGNSDSLPNDILESWEGVTDRHGKGKIGEFSIGACDDASESNDSILTSDAISAVTEALALARKKETVCLTSVVGRVEVVDMHNKKKIIVYPRVKKWNHVHVSFDDSLTQEVLNSINKVAEISGKGHYRPKQPLPYKMQMKNIRILPDPSTLPNLLDMKGIAPDVTDGKSVQEYKDDLRKEWER